MSIHSIALPPALFYIFHFRDRRGRACRNVGRSLAVPATEGVRDMAQNAAETRSPRRTAPKEERQLQLVRATIRSVAAHGLSDTTMATVANTAGLSQGIINLHFRTKQRLLVATLRHLADRVATRLRAKARAGRTITVRVRFADLRSVTRSVTLPAAISATVMSQTRRWSSSM